MTKQVTSFRGNKWVLTCFLSHQGSYPWFQISPEGFVYTGAFSHPQSSHLSERWQTHQIEETTAGISHTSSLLKGSWRGDGVREWDLTVWMGVWFELGGVLVWKKRGVGVEKKKRKTMLQEKKEHNSEIHGFKKGRKKVCTFLCGGQWIGCSLLLRWFSLSLSPDAHTHILHTHRFCVRCYKERQLAFQPGSTGYVWWSNKLYNLFFFFPPSCRLPFVKQALV